MIICTHNLAISAHDGIIHVLNLHSVNAVSRVRHLFEAVSSDHETGEIVHLLYAEKNFFLHSSESA